MKTKACIPLLVLLSALLFTGCFARLGGQVIGGKDAVIHFLGNRSGTVAEIEGYEPLTLDDSKREWVNVAPGTRQLVVRRGSEILVSRKLVLDAGITLEVKIP